MTEEEKQTIVNAYNMMRLAAERSEGSWQYHQQLQAACNLIGRLLDRTIHAEDADATTNTNPE
jgi:hypothetical protein